MKKLFAAIAVSLSLAGCMQVDKPAVKDAVMISCTDLRDGEKFMFMNTMITNYERGFTDEYITFKDMNGTERTLSGKVMLEQMKCTKTPVQSGSA